MEWTNPLCILPSSVLDQNRNRTCWISGNGFYWLDILPVTKPTASKHWRKVRALIQTSALAWSFLTINSLNPGSRFPAKKRLTFPRVAGKPAIASLDISHVVCKPAIFSIFRQTFGRLGYGYMVTVGQIQGTRDQRVKQMCFLLPTTVYHHVMLLLNGWWHMACNAHNNSNTFLHSYMQSW